MNAAELVDALHLPAGARVDQRVPKKLLVENGAPTAADKRRINEGVEEAQWVATLKPTTVGVPAYRDSARDYLEIVVLSLLLRPEAQASRLAELVHRAVPYPVLLIASQADALQVSMGHKRWSEGEVGATVLDGPLVIASLRAAHDEGFERAFLDSLALTQLPCVDLFALYQGWMDCLLALLAARVTGSLVRAHSAEHAAGRRAALAECERLEAEMRTIRAAAAKERQVSRQVQLNMELHRLQAEHTVARAKL